MKILIADDDTVGLSLIAALLTRRGYEIEAVTDGVEAWERLSQPDAPRIALLDWLMPGIDGIEICRRARSKIEGPAPYLILLTMRDTNEYVVEGLNAGANDYITKPFYPDELVARVRIAVRTVELQDELTCRVRQLEEAVGKVKQLQGLLPMCTYCKSVRNDKNYWQRVEDYLGANTDFRCSHGICPNCWETVVQRQFAAAGIPVAEYPVS